MKITDFVLDKTNPANFVRYRAGHLYYDVMNTATKEVFEFPVDAEDLQGATINASERAITLMRYINKALKENQLVHVRNVPEP